jgi:hypothetical protein
VNEQTLRAESTSELQLELRRLRAQAELARLEARAAEIELVLLARAQSQYASEDESIGRESTMAAAQPPAITPSTSRPVAEHWASSHPAEGKSHLETHGAADRRIDAAEALIAAIRSAIADQQQAVPAAAGDTAAPSPEAPGGWQARLDGLHRRSDFPPTPQPLTPADSDAMTKVAEAPQRRQQEHSSADAANATQARPEILLRFDSPATAPEPRLVRSREYRRDLSEPEHLVDASRAYADQSQRTEPVSSGPEPAQPNRPLPEALPAKQPQPDLPPLIQPSPKQSAAKETEFKQLASSERRGERGGGPGARSKAEPNTAVGPGNLKIDTSGQTATANTAARSSSARTAASSPIKIPQVAEADVTDEKPTDEAVRKRLRPAAWLTSMIAHLVALILLGLMTLSTQKPRDQLAFSASVSEASHEEVETFTIEMSEVVPEDSQPQPADTQLEISPVGTMQAADVSLDLPEAPPAIATDLFGSGASAMSSLAKAASGDTQAAVSFAGVEGGGNHFVYLVDSSNSMKNFNEARLELLRSVDSLQSHQRFYVVFYDQDPDYMRISDPNQDEPTSVLATPANKAALRRWAITIQQERGKSPIDVLRFAFALRPDVIFLLSDGEFSARTETVIRENNRQTNLFGDEGPISIIHTIRYPGYSAAEARNAEVQMKRIAEENGGQYRNVVIQ